MSAGLERIKRAAAKNTTPTLFSALDELEAREALTPEERMVKAAISDVITQRHALDAALDVIFSDDDYAGTYTDALRQALKESGHAASLPVIIGGEVVL